MRKPCVFLLCLCWLVFANLRQPLSAQDTVSRSDQAISTTVCELTKNGAQSNGKRVSIRAGVVGGFGHGILLFDLKKHCPHGLSMDAPETVRDHDDYKAFEHALYGEGGAIGALRKKGDKRVSATFVGTFEYRPSEPRLKWVLQVERISNIEVKPKGA